MMPCEVESAGWFVAARKGPSVAQGEPLTVVENCKGKLKDALDAVEVRVMTLETRLYSVMADEKVAGDAGNAKPVDAGGSSPLARDTWETAMRLSSLAQRLESILRRLEV